jgi:hypothetical protein
MKKSPKFSLVLKPLVDASKHMKTLESGKQFFSHSITESDSYVDFSRATQAINKSLSSPELNKVFNKLDQPFRETLVSSFVNMSGAETKNANIDLPTVNDNIEFIIKELARNDKVFRVGILDLGAWIGKLPIFLEKINAVQSLFTIFEIQAPIPGGLLKTPDGMAEWAYEHLKRELSDIERNEIGQNLIADDFFIAGEHICEKMGLDFIVGITPAMVAGTSGNRIYWNHFSSVLSRAILLSTANLRQFADQAGRPFEAAIGVLLVPSLLIAINESLHYHDNSGCLFDYNGDRVSIVETIKTMQIEESCLEKMTSEQQAFAENILKTLKRMRSRNK